MGLGEGTLPGRGLYSPDVRSRMAIVGKTRHRAHTESHRRKAASRNSAAWRKEFARREQREKKKFLLPVLPP